MTKTMTGYIKKDKSLRNHITRHKVINILRQAEMDNKASADESNDKMSTAATSADERNDFFNTGRIGRRNALPDILGSHCTTTTSELPLLLDSLTTKEQTTAAEPGPSTSSQQQNSTETSKPVNN